MRIGITTSVIQNGKTGISRYLLSLLREYLKIDGPHEFFLYVLESDAHLFDFAKDKCRIHLLPKRFANPVKNIYWHHVYLPIEAKKHRLDVLHIPSYRRMIWSKPCATVSTIHDLAQFNVSNKYDPLRMFYGKKIVPFLARRQDRIIAISQYTAHDIRNHFGISGEQISVIYNGLDHERYHPGSQTEASQNIAVRYGLQGEYFLYVSRLEHPAKNHIRLIDAFNRFKADIRSSTQLVLAGGDWHGAEEIHKAVTNSPFSRDIKLLGFVEDRYLPDLYRSAMIFVYPSLFEGFGLPPLEAMACGCAVISSPNGALSEVMGQAALYVDPFDVSSIQRKLSCMYLDEKYRNQLRSNGLARAKEFSWAHSAKNTLQIYESAAKQTAKEPEAQFA